jgi:hypothetical protein
MLGSAGFQQVRAHDITVNFKPSIARYRRLLVLPYGMVTLRIRGGVSNVTSIVEVHQMVEEGLVGYHLLRRPWAGPTYVGT